MFLQAIIRDKSSYLKRTNKRFSFFPQIIIINVSIQLLKKPTNFSKIYKKIHEKVYK